MNNVYPDPDYAKTAVEHFRDAHGRISSEKEEILYLLSSYSRFLGRSVIKYPDILDMLGDSDEVRRKKSLEELISVPTRIAESSESKDELMSALRRYKYRELSRIVYRDIMDVCNFRDTMEELSDLASGILESAFIFFGKDMDLAQNRFVVLGMGKLGGRELNLSSDIDLIYLYETADPDPIFKLAERITNALSAITEDGFLYRVDLGLRPGGGKSPIALSLEGALEHYFYWGDTWERAALIKVRPVAGDLCLGQEFEREIESFVYKKNLDYASIEDLKDMKTKLDRLHKKRDVKLGKGGIREIEFFVQALQLVNGGAIPQIREKSTMKALAKLRNFKIIEEDVFERLSSAYIFLRKVEHAVQLVDERQTHKVPKKEENLQKLAKRVGMDGGEEFEKEFELKTGDVSLIYDELFYEPSKQVEEVGKEFWELADFLTEGHIQEERAIENLSNLGFKYPESAIEIISALLDPKKGGLTQKGRTLTRRVIPAFLAKILSSSDPDAALRNLERFVSSVGWRTSLYAVLSENPDIIALLARLFSTSGYLSNFLIKHPEYLDILTLNEARKEYGSKEEMLGELEKSLEYEGRYEDKLDAIRRFRNVETLKLCLRDLNREVDPVYVGKHLSMLAEAILEVGLSIAGQALSSKSGTEDKSSDMVILGMGKLGGGEMSYNSDLDVIFIYAGENHEVFSKLGQRVISVLSIPTSEGFAYKIDTGLRPSGNAGTLVSSFKSFEKYHEESAKLWERQSLLRAKPVAGNMKLGDKVMKIVRRFVYEKPLPEDFRDKIYHLRSRMEKEVAKESTEKLNLKTGKGGLVDIEFLIQMLQLQFGKEHEEVRRQNTLEALSGLRKCGGVEENEFRILHDGYYFLKRMENLLRLLHDRSISELHEGDFRRIAQELDMKESGDELREHYLSKTEKIRTIYEKYFSH